MKKVAIIGSHGLYANYGGWDQLVLNLAELKSKSILYIIYNSADTKKVDKYPPNVKVVTSRFKASGFEGLLFDFSTLLNCFFGIDTILFFRVQGIPLIPLLLPFKKVKIVCNSGGIEWERTKFGILSRLYLRICFRLSLIYSNHVIIDNKYFEKYIPRNINSKIQVIPYGGTIDKSLKISKSMLKKYPFLKSEYYLSISRAIEDNMIRELCQSFSKSDNVLVIISNFCSTNYGKGLLKEFDGFKNIIMISGLYHKPELDLIRRSCKIYIHSHMKCGTAPSLVEMIVAKKPILSIDVPQNRNTMNGEGYYFQDFSLLQENINEIKNKIETISNTMISKYAWGHIIKDYESLF